MRWNAPFDIAYAEPPSRISEERYQALPCRWEWLARLCDEAYGLPRHLSQHSGGMIVSTRPLIDCCPVLPAAMEGRQLCQWDKDSCADAGFLKIDLLGLGMLVAPSQTAMPGLPPAYPSPGGGDLGLPTNPGVGQLGPLLGMLLPGLKMIGALTTIGGGVLSFFFLAALGYGLHLLLDMEENTRITAHALAQIARRQGN